MSERFRERLGYLSEELEGHLRSTSPAGSRSPRRASRSPRPSALSGESSTPAVGVTHPLVRDSRPDIAAWPAPPANPPPVARTAPRTRKEENATPATATVSALQTLSSAPISPASNASSKHEFEDSHSFLSMLKVSAVSDSSNSLDGRGVPRGRETELKRKIQTLEETVAEYERQKFNVMGTFSEYRERVAERERKLEAEYSNKIISLSEDVLGAKKDFEARMKSFQTLQEKFEREKEQALEKLRQEHQKEIQLLEQRFSESQLLNLEQKYMLEIQRLEEERKSLRSEKERLGETFEMKLRRAQSLYETELTAAKMLYTKELEALRDHEDALKEELVARQEEFHDRLQELQHHAKRSRDELTSCKNEVSALEKKLQSKEAEVHVISKELYTARTETNDSLRRLTQSSGDMDGLKKQFEEQQDELKKKSKLLNVVEAAKSKLEAMIRDLQSEVKALKNKVEFLEKERENLQSQSESQAHLQCSQVDALEAVLESVTKEKENTKEHYESLLSKERAQAEAREHAMKKEFSSKLNELEEQYTSLKEDLEQAAIADKNEIQESAQLEINSLRSENAVLVVEVETLKQRFMNDEESLDDTCSRLAAIVEETTTMSKSLEEYREKMKMKDEEVLSLKRRLEEEKSLSEEQLDALRSELRNEMLSSEDFTRNIHEIEQLHSKIAEIEREREKEQEQEEERFHVLNEQNSALKAELQHVQKAFDGMESAQESLKELDELRVRVEQRDHEIQSLKLKAQEAEDRAALAEKANDSKSVENHDVKKELEELRADNESKTSAIKTLHDRVKELTDQMGDIRNELEKKSTELNEIELKNDEFLRKNNLLEDSITDKNRSQDKALETLKKREMDLSLEVTSLKEQLRDAKQQESLEIAHIREENELLVAEKVTIIEQLEAHNDNSNTARAEDLKAKVEELTHMEEALANKENNLKTKETELIQLKEEMKVDLDQRERDLAEKEKELREREENLSEEREREISPVSTLCCESQTEPLAVPDAVVDFAREKEFKDRIEELESALERKTELIHQLQDRMPSEDYETLPKKKDRSQSMTSTGMFQSIVSQMKDKREEAHERSKKKEAEKKAAKEAKEAVKELVKEREDNTRSKSPSLLTRLRDRSPAKSRSPNLETTPSSSSRNLLSPSDAERPMERRGSPSRPLFSKSKKEPCPKDPPVHKDLSQTPSEKRPAWKF